MVLTNYHAKITAVSTGETIRGTRHETERPDLIICDDIEDTQSVKTKDGREKTWTFINSEVFATSDKNTKKIIIGNLVHEDSVIMRLRKKIDEGKILGVFKAYPLVTKDGHILWPGKFPTLKDIEYFKKTTVANDIDWLREYLLKILPTTDQVVYKEWISYYDKKDLPSRDCYVKTGTGIDLAIKQNETSDCTSTVTADAYKVDGNPLIFIHPFPFNKKVTFPQTIDQIKILCQLLGGKLATTLYVETVAYQASLSQQLEVEGFAVEEVKVSIGKRERLIMVSSWIRDAKIRFLKHGCEELIQQVLNFGVEPYDDLVDAFTIVCSKLIEELTEPEPQMYIF